jgi:hypothetical protein
MCSTEWVFFPDLLTQIVKTTAEQKHSNSRLPEYAALLLVVATRHRHAMGKVVCRDMHRACKGARHVEEILSAS